MVMDAGRQWWALALALLLLLQPSFSHKKDKNLNCSVCRAVIEEVNAQIGDVDPKKKVKVGSFRVDSDGNQKLVEKQYARSDVHLTEIFENICNSFEEYGLTQSSDGKLGVKRIKSRTGEDLGIQSVGHNENIIRTFKGYCESLVDEYEDEMLGLFKQENLQSAEAELCGDIANVCPEDVLPRPASKSHLKKHHTRNALHDDEDDEDDITDEDLDSNIVEPSNNKSKKGKKDEL